MSRPGNTTHVTDSTDSGSTQKSAATTEGRSDRGQPRPSGLENTRMPSAAERTRTLVQSTCSAVLLIPGLETAGSDQLMPLSRTVGPDGDLFLEFPAESPAVRAATHALDDELAAVLEITDVAPVSVPHRIRGRARVCGWLTSVPGMVGPGRMLLRLETGEAHVEDLWGAEAVEPEELRDAAADPLAAHEAELLQHLHAAHGERLGTLCELLGDRSARAGTRPALRRTGRSGPPRTASPLLRAERALLRRPLRVPRAGARHDGAAPRHAHPLRCGRPLRPARPRRRRGGAPDPGRYEPSGALAAPSASVRPRRSRTRSATSA